VSTPVNEVEVVLIVVAEIPHVSVTRQTMQYLPRTGTSVHPFKFRWTPETDDGMIPFYLLGLPMESIANKLVYRFTTKQAQGWGRNRLNVLKLSKQIPERWQRVYLVKGNRSGSRHVQTRGLVVWTARLARERCKDRGGGVGEIKGSRDVFRTIQAVRALQLARGGVESAYGWYGGRSPNVSKRLSDCCGRGRIKCRI
jgi:hypothetical protein